MLKKATWRGVTLPALLSFKLPLPRGGFIQRRLLFLFPQLFVVSIITFLLVHVLLPGNPAEKLLGPFHTEKQEDALEEKLGLHDPLPVQYAIYIKGIFQGDFGDSVFTSQPVAKDIRERLPRTVELITIALFFSLLIMVPLGIRAAAPKQTGKAGVIDRAIGRVFNLYGLLAGSLADFWLALILIFIFFTKLGWAPEPLGPLGLVAEPDRVTGFLTIDSIITGNLDALRSYLAHLVLPLATLVFVYGGPILKATMSAMREIQQSSYMENAQAMGLKLGTRRRYAFRNALPPVITMVGVVYGFLLGGAVLVETVFGLNGVGAYGVKAVEESDYAAIQSFVLVAAVFVMAVYLIVDLLHAWSDPRIRL